MSRPASKTSRQHIAKFQKFLNWLLFGVVIVAILIDSLLGYRLYFAKGLILGALVGYLMQSVFTFINYSKIHHNQGAAKAGTQMMASMYLAILAKWAIGLLGFGLIFVFVKEMMVAAVFVGLMIMQLGIGVGLYQLGKKKS